MHSVLRGCDQRQPGGVYAAFLREIFTTEYCTFWKVCGCAPLSQRGEMRAAAEQQKRDFHALPAPEI